MISADILDDEDAFQAWQEEQQRLFWIGRLLDAVHVFAPEISLKTFFSEYRLQTATKIAGLSL